MSVSFTLFHSPLVGSLTWTLVADELAQKGFNVLVPHLMTEVHKQPFWKHHVADIERLIALASTESALVLVGHSGAGVLLPAVRENTRRSVKGCIFVDADIPRDRASRLDLFLTTEEAEKFRNAATYGWMPTWNEDDLSDVIIEDEHRRRFVNELRPLPLAVYEEPLTVFDTWPDVPCSYLQFSSAYQASAEYAQQASWRYKKIDAGHFHMLVDPVSVAEALVELAEL